MIELKKKAGRLQLSKRSSALLPGLCYIGSRGKWLWKQQHHSMRKRQKTFCSTGVQKVSLLLYTFKTTGFAAAP